MSKQVLNDGVLYIEQRTKINANFDELYSQRQVVSVSGAAQELSLSGADCVPGVLNVFPGSGDTVSVRLRTSGGWGSTSTYTAATQINVPIGTISFEVQVTAGSSGLSKAVFDSVARSVGSTVATGLVSSDATAPSATDTFLVILGKLWARETLYQDRSTHTGTQVASTISDFSTAADARVTATGPGVTRSTVATGLVSSDATAPAATDTFLVILGKLWARETLYQDRSTHTGTQVASTISDFNTAADARVTATGPSVTRSTIATGLVSSDATAPAATDTFLVILGKLWARGIALVTGSGLRMNTAKILGRTTASSGAIEEITVGSGLSLSGGTLTATGGGGGSTHLGNVADQTEMVALSTAVVGSTCTRTDFSPGHIFMLATGVYSTAANWSDLTVAYQDRSTHTGTQVASTISDFSTAADARVTATGPDVTRSTVATGLVSSDATAPAATDTFLVILGKLWARGIALITGSGLQMNTAKILGRTTASSGAIEEITVGTGLSLSGGTLIATGGGGSSTHLGNVANQTEMTALSAAVVGSTCTRTDFSPGHIFMLATGTYSSASNWSDLTIAYQDRSTHTGTQVASTISDFSTAADARVTATGPSVTRSTVATGLVSSDATAPSATDTFLVILGKLWARETLYQDRSTHTGTQVASTISDFSTAADARVTATGPGVTRSTVATGLVSSDATAPAATDTFLVILGKLWARGIALITGSGLQMNTAKILGRTTASSGAIEEITVGTGLSLSGGNLTATGQQHLGNVASQSAMIALSSAVVGSTCTRTDFTPNRVFMLATGVYSTAANWSDLTHTGNDVAGGGSASVASGKTLTVSNTLTLTGTDSSTVDFGAGGKMAVSNDAATALTTSTTLVRSTHGNRWLPITSGSTFTIDDDTAGGWTDSDTIYGRNNGSSSIVFAGDVSPNVTLVAETGCSLTAYPGQTFSFTRIGSNSWIGGALNILRTVVVDVSGDESTALTTGTGKRVFQWPFAFKILNVYATVTTAPTGSTAIVDINLNGSTIMTTNKLSIDATEKTSVTATTAAALTTTTVALWDECTVDVDQIGSTVAGAGLKVYFTGYAT